MLGRARGRRALNLLLGLLAARLAIEDTQFRDHFGTGSTTRISHVGVPGTAGAAAPAASATSR